MSTGTWDWVTSAREAVQGAPNRVMDAAFGEPKASYDPAPVKHYDNYTVRPRTAADMPKGYYNLPTFNVATTTQNAQNLAAQANAPAMAQVQYQNEQANRANAYATQQQQHDYLAQQSQLAQQKIAPNMDLKYAPLDFKTAQDTATIGTASADVRAQAAARQQGYINDMLGFTQQDIGLRDAIGNVDLAAAERVNPLLLQQRQDIEQKVVLLRQDIAGASKQSTEDERAKQLDEYVQASANGATGGAAGVARSMKAAEDLKNELAANERKRQQGEIEYQAALRDNTEKQAQAQDAIEKIKLEAQRRDIEKQNAARKAEEDRQAAKDAETQANLDKYQQAVNLNNARNVLARSQEQAMLQLKAIQDAANLEKWNAAVAANRQRDAFLATLTQNAAAEAKAKADQEALAAYFAAVNAQNQRPAPTPLPYNDARANMTALKLR